MSEVREAMASVLASPKFGFFAAIVANISEWYLDWGSSLISALTSIAGLILLFVLIRYHWINTTKLKQSIIKATLNEVLKNKE